MFFPELIKSISPTDIILEIGPGSLPHPRSDIYLEKEFDEINVVSQRGFAKEIKLSKPVIYYKELPFPFSDKEFDYVICSHVIEHVSIEELPQFISELQRISKQGYIEFPTVFYELINYQPVHVWLMNFRDNNILFMDKKLFQSNSIHKIYREMFYSEDNYLSIIFTKYPELFFYGFEWKDNIQFKIIDKFEDLVNNEDFEKQKKYFNSITQETYEINGKQKKELQINKKMIKRFIKKFIPDIFLDFWINKIKSNLNSNDIEFYIDKTAIIDKIELVEIQKHAEIKDYVIIRTFQNKVFIGESTQINPFTVIYGGSGVYIGNNVMIAPHCMIAAGNHDFKQLLLPMRFAGNLTKGPIVIEDDVWIGSNCTITDGVRIGEGSVIAANSCVVTDVEPYSIYGGSPAKKIGKRK